MQFFLKVGILDTSPLCGKAKQWRVNEPELSRRRKIPKRFDDGLSGGAFPDTPKSYYRQAYYEGLDLITNCIQERFTQEGYATYSSIEALLVKACCQQDFETELAAVCAFYSDDFDKSLLHVQWVTLGVCFAQTAWNKSSTDEEKRPTVRDIIIFFRPLLAA